MRLRGISRLHTVTQRIFIVDTGMRRILLLVVGVLIAQVHRVEPQERVVGKEQRTAHFFAERPPLQQLTQHMDAQKTRGTSQIR